MSPLRFSLHCIPGPLAIALAVALALPAAASPVARAAPTPHASHAETTPADSFQFRPFSFARLPLANRYAPHNLRAYLSHPRDADGVPLRKVGGKLVYLPTTVGWAGVEMLALYLRQGTQADLDIARACAKKLQDLLADAGNTGWLPWNVPNPENRLSPPWYNALSQGIALALFSRFYKLEGLPSDLDTANLLFGTFEKLGPAKHPWVSQVDGNGHIWFEHYAGGYHEHVLNAHLWATFGLYDYWLVAPSADSLRYLEGGVTTARDKAHKFRRPGQVSWYCLIHKVARPRYQSFHVQELRVLSVVTRTPYFAKLAALLLADDPPS